GTLWITQSMSKVLQSEGSWTVLRIGTHRLEDIRNLERKLEKFLEKQFPGAEVYIWDGNAKNLLKEKETLEIASRSLTVVGLIALAIGGVGIANITIASVLERTKEIGLRRAIGATEFDIMLQFILEAVLLSVLGGTAAIGTVHGLTHIVTTTIVEAPYEFSVSNAGWAMASAILVGVGSSFFPALRATHVDIVEALRGD
ncbi:MAG: FtsX-like permease family protein, partial [Leptolyngbyaceae cyanobacterium bins.59]|nr:FtsX-like permease family protein [Leptolyngbyaceae cyanobacterium bins.59]